MIYDGHAYCIPDLRGDGGFESREEFQRLLQFITAHHFQPAWRVRDRAPRRQPRARGSLASLRPRRGQAGPLPGHRQRAPGMGVGRRGLLQAHAASAHHRHVLRRGPDGGGDGLRGRGLGLAAPHSLSRNRQRLLRRLLPAASRAPAGARLRAGMEDSRRPPMGRFGSSTAPSTRWACTDCSSFPTSPFSTASRRTGTGAATSPSGKRSRTCAYPSSSPSSPSRRRRWKATSRSCGACADGWSATPTWTRCSLTASTGYAFSTTVSCAFPTRCTRQLPATIRAFGCRFSSRCSSAWCSTTRCFSSSRRLRR